MTHHRTGRTGLTVFLSLLCAVSSPAHHNASIIYDTGKTIALQGIITGLDWRNPHSSLTIGVQDADGRITTWQVELASTGTLEKAGFDRNLLDPDRPHSVQVFPARDGKPQALGLVLTLPDGKTIKLDDGSTQTAPSR